MFKRVAFRSLRSQEGAHKTTMETEYRWRLRDVVDADDMERTKVKDDGGVKNFLKTCDRNRRRDRLLGMWK